MLVEYSGNFLFVMKVPSIHSHGCKLQLDWLAEEYNHETVNLIF